MTAMYYASVGPELAAYAIDVGQATLARKSAVTLPANVQYVWPHPSRRTLYVASSTGGPGSAGTEHYLNAFRVDPQNGALSPHGKPQVLRSRPVHLCVDRAGKHVLTAYNIPSAVTVHRIEADETLGQEVPQSGLETGIFGHQVVVTPGDKTAILVARGNDAANGKPEDPGSLRVFRFQDGKLSNHACVAPGGGLGFGPRHLDFHPTRPFVFAAIERQNQLHVYALAADGNLSPAPLFVRSTLARPDAVRGRQLVGAIHVHPNGRFVYVSNRSGSTSVAEQNRVAEGEDSIAVFALDPSTGEPTLIQNAETNGIHTRNFGIDPSGKLLVSSSIIAQSVRDGSGLRPVPAGLSVFRVGDDGKLAFQRKYDVDTGRLMQFWSGMIPLS
jgi:6-phosphogluconolactonase